MPGVKMRKLGAQGRKDVCRYTAGQEWLSVRRRLEEKPPGSRGSLEFPRLPGPWLGTWAGSQVFSADAL